jgi:hypothetical protein
MSEHPSNLPGKGLLGWLGRQVGYVSGAVKAKPGVPANDRPVQAPRPAPAAPVPKVIYRDDKVEELPHPTEPGVTLRRTIIDEVVVKDGGAAAAAAARDARPPGDRP